MAGAGAPPEAVTIHRVDANVYIGGYLAAADAELVARLGIRRIVKMFADAGGYPGGEHRHPGVAYAVFAALDDPAYDIRQDAVSALHFIRDGLLAGERVLVHCHAGVSRSATIVLLHLMAHRGYGLDAALAHLRGIRPVVAPNRGFMAHLRATDNWLRGRRSWLQERPPPPPSRPPPPPPPPPPSRPPPPPPSRG
jgi:hypothetical protein